MRILKYFVLFILFFTFLLLFFPKKSLYYYGLKNLESYNLSLVHKNINSGFNSLSLNDIDFTYDGVKLLNSKNIKVESLLFKTTIQIENIALDSLLSNIVNIKIDNLILKHNIIETNKIYIKSKFDKGILDGFIDFDTGLLKVRFKLADSFVLENQELLKALKKDSLGEYYLYEQQI